MVRCGRAHDDDHAAPSGASGAAGPARIDEPSVDDIDLSELTDAPAESVRTPLDRLAEAFPGSEFVNES